MAKIVLTPSDLSAEDFKVTKDTDGGSIIRINNDKPITSYVAHRPATSVATFTDTGTDRHTLWLNGNFGYLHLDFTCRKTQCLVGDNFNLPNSAPTPKGLLEVQTRDGGTIWLTRNARNIRWSGLTVGQRYIVDIIGFWNV